MANLKDVREFHEVLRERLETKGCLECDSPIQTKHRQGIRGWAYWRCGNSECPRSQKWSYLFADAFEFQAYALRRVMAKAREVARLG